MVHGGKKSCVRHLTREARDDVMIHDDVCVSLCVVFLVNVSFHFLYRSVDALQLQLHHTVTIV